MKIKPIETEYNGYKFRSRLEARWALFFDKLEIKYEYELEGFEIGNGLRYLPDFYLPQMKIFVEIKPSLDALDERDIDQITGYVACGNPLLLIVGSPSFQNIYLVESPFADIEGCKEMAAKYNSTINDVFELSLDSMNTSVEFVYAPLLKSYTLKYKHDIYFSHEVKISLNEAKQARFEFASKRLKASSEVKGMLKQSKQYG